MNIREEELTVVPEDMLDLHELRANGVDLMSIITNHWWHHYISLLNGPTYSELVKYFWSINLMLIPRSHIPLLMDNFQMDQLKLSDSFFFGGRFFFL